MKWTLCLGLTVVVTAGGPSVRAAANGASGAAETAWMPSPAFTQLVDRARGLSAEPYRDRDLPLPEALARLDYDGHRDIRNQPADFLWHGGDEPFRVQFRHRGWLFQDEVRLSLVDADANGVQPLPFDAERFTYGPLALDKLDPQTLPGDLGYAGLALHRVGFETIDGQTAETFNEFMSIQGGSYFRAIGHGQHWGSSGRGVAVNTGLPQPEEFPRWVELWVQRPHPGDESLVLYGLMDGPSVAGAYRFHITPGTEDRPTLSMDVRVHLFFRAAVDKLGLAPITSMFLFGESTPARFGDYRPEVHDADGLLMQHNSGELDWRPLRNPHQTRVSRFEMTDPAGFGLLQRDRNFNHYEDLETEMQIRPSVWVVPKHFVFRPDPGIVTSNNGGGWGAGWVELFEIASDDEGIDNIGAYWVPADEADVGPGSEIEIAYRLDFTQQPRPIGRELMPWFASRAMLGDGGEDENEKSLVRTAVDDEAAAGRPVARFVLDTTPDSALPSGTIVRADVTAYRGEVFGEPIVQYNRFNHAYRLTFDVIAHGPEPVEVRATLRGATELDRKKEAAPEGTYDGVEDPDVGPPLSENWLYRWDPK
ncbi:MAG: glucan biosynthesis protein [Planctomycetota bacterium]